MSHRALFALAGFLVVALSAFAQPKSGLRFPPALDPEEAAQKGKALVAELLAQRPAQNSTNTGRLVIHGPGKKQKREVPVRFEVFNTDTNWASVYETTGAGPGAGVRLQVIHAGEQPSEYWLTEPSAGGNAAPRRLAGSAAMTPFAGSDFWLADLGLEFFHWPKQALTRQQMRKNMSCNVLESTNPEVAPGGYSRVVSWIDIDSGGIVHADAYDARGELLKQFDPKEFEKVQGQWQLREMEIYNAQTRTRTQIVFDLDKPAR